MGKRRAGRGWVALDLQPLLMLLTMDVAQAQYWGSPYGRGGYYYRQRRAIPSSACPGTTTTGRGGRAAACSRAASGPPWTGWSRAPSPSRAAIPSAASSSTPRDASCSWCKSPTEALHYPISVGREGFSWTGTETISRKAEWPDWHPPEEMRWRDPRLPEKMTGGIKNPLGAMALYLGNSLYRIHGTNDAELDRPRRLLGLLPHAQRPRRRSGRAGGYRHHRARWCTACRRSWRRSWPSRWRRPRRPSRLRPPHRRGAPGRPDPADANLASLSSRDLCRGPVSTASARRVR